MFVCLSVKDYVSISAITALMDMKISGKLIWMFISTSVMAQSELLCHHFPEVTQWVSSGNNGRMNGRNLLKENICYIIFSS
jgi:hypothetical protein